MDQDDKSSLEEFDVDPRYEYDVPGLLTETQRLYLHDKSDIESGTQHERTVRSRIRERVTNLFKDIEILSDGLEDRDITQIYRQISEDHTISWDPYTRFGMIIGFLIRVYEDIPMYYERENIDASKFEDRMELVMSGAIQYALQAEGYHLKLSCDIDIEAQSVSEFDENLGTLNDSELFSLYKSEEITHEEYIEELENRRE
jgi:hypothetical protein